MLAMRYCSFLMAGFMFLVGAGVVAQTQATLTAEKNRLARMEQSLENRMVEIENIENELLSYEYKLKRAEESLQKAHAKHEEDRRELQQAERDHKQNAGSDTERQLRKARHAFAMAERGVDSRGRRVEIIKSNYDELKAQLDAGRRAVSRGETRIADQRETAERMAEAIQAREEAARRTAAVAAPAGKPELPTPPVDAAPERAAPEAATGGQRQVDPELLEYAKRESARLHELLDDGGGDGKHTFRSLALEPTRGESLPFEFLGHDQYRLVASVEAGRQTYRVNTWKFRRTIPADDDGERYVFIFDARRLSRPRLVMYPEYVLSHLD